MSNENDLLTKIKAFNDTIWENKAKESQIYAWLANFESPANGTEDERKLHALYLLSQFMYFGVRQIRELMRVLYRDLYKYPLVQQIRENNGDTTDVKMINRKFTDALERTRFLGVGNPSESGNHLLYYLRQENELHAECFTNGSDILKNRNVDRYVFVDDFCGSGHQARDYLTKIVGPIKAFDSTVKVFYFVLFATPEGMNLIRNNTQCDDVQCIFELDDSFRCFSCASRYFPSSEQPTIIAQFAEEMCRRYGRLLKPAAPLGYDNCQLLIGFQHNTPDNTLPIFWSAGSTGNPWKPIFKRYTKT